MTEQWDLSIALFHATMASNQRIKPAELHNMRPGRYSSHFQQPQRWTDLVHEEAMDPLKPPHVYDARDLEGVWDPADEQIFLAAARRMSRDASTRLGEGAGTGGQARAMLTLLSEPRSCMRERCCGTVNAGRPPSWRRRAPV